MLNFYFLDKGLGIVSPAHFVHGFSTEMFLMLYSINWTSFIVWLPLLLKILGNICIAIVCYPGCDVIDFEINVFFLIEPFFSTWPKSHDKNLNILRTKRAFLTWNKKLFSSFLKGFYISRIVSDLRVRL